EGPTGVLIAPQTCDRRCIDGAVLFDKSCHGLISRLSILLIEQSLQFWCELLLLLIGNIAEHVIHLMHHTALSSRGGKFLRDGIEHGLVAITDPEVNGFDPSLFEVFQQVFPSLLIFSIAHAEREYFP